MAKYGINKAILVGNLGKDPEVRHLDQGIAVANFSLATTERFKNAQGQVIDRTEWHNIVMWRGLAETAGKYLRKGSSVYLEGKIITRSWDSPEGIKKYRTEIEADKMIMLDSRSASSGEGGFGNSQGSNPAQSSSYQQPASQKPQQQAAPASFQGGPEEEEDDDLPF